MIDWNFICLSPCILILGGLALFVSYAFLDHVYGSQGAKLVWPYELGQFVLFMLVAAAASLAIDEIPLRGEGFIIVVFGTIVISCLLAAANTIRVRWRIHSAKQVLFSSDERSAAVKASLAVVCLMALVLVSMLLVLAPVSTAIYRVTILLFGLFLIIMGLNSYYRTRYPLIVTTLGLIAGGATYQWSKIRLYHLAPPRRSTPLILRVKSWFSLTNTVIIPVALDESNEVSALLAEKLPGLRYGGQPSPNIDAAVVNPPARNHV